MNMLNHFQEVDQEPRTENQRTFDTGEFPKSNDEHESFHDAIEAEHRINI